MIPNAVDYASPVSRGAVRKLINSAAIRGFGRYLVPEAWNSWKRLTREEAEMITEEGGKLFSFWESTSGRAAEGAEAGKTDAIFALQAAGEVGQPTGTVICATVDFEAAASQYDAIEAYFRSFQADLAGFKAGLYGSYFVIEEMKSRGLDLFYVQTVAWSHGKRSEHASLFQFQIDTKLQGADVDLCEAADFEGWWDTNMADIPQLPARDFSDDEAVKVCDDLSALYNASGAPGVQEAAHYAAEALRGNPLPVFTFNQDDAQKVIKDLGALYDASVIGGVQSAAHFAAVSLRSATSIKE